MEESVLFDRARNHGFESNARKEAWHALLSSVPLPRRATNVVCESDAHSIRLDAKRALGSFVDHENLEGMQERLESVLLEALRRAPKGSRYLQGLHDVASVVLLAMDGDDKGAVEILSRVMRSKLSDLLMDERATSIVPAGSQDMACEGSHEAKEPTSDASSAVASVHHVQGSDQSPSYSSQQEKIALEERKSKISGPRGLSRVASRLENLHDLVSKKDRRLAKALRRSGVRPIYALSWVMTWFSHDNENLEAVLRLFDLFLASHEAMPLYLAAVHVASHREEVMEATRREKMERFGRQGVKKQDNWFQVAAVCGALTAYAAGSLRRFVFPREAWLDLLQAWKVLRMEQPRWANVGGALMFGIACTWLANVALRHLQRREWEIPRDAPEVYSALRHLPPMTPADAQRNSLAALELFRKHPPNSLRICPWRQ